MYFIRSFIFRIKNKSNLNLLLEMFCNMNYIKHHVYDCIKLAKKAFSRLLDFDVIIVITTQ